MTTLADVHQTFVAWFGKDYDLAAIDAVLAVAAAERLDGDPAWLLLLSGSGNAKTETVQPLAAAGALVTSTVASEGALLSGSAAREKAKDATGGLLRRLGDHGILVIKDVASILSMHSDTRSSMLTALREVYDGYWERNVGMDGGRSLAWRGRLVVIGACTTAWDKAHDVIASMGDRFVLLRLDSFTGRQTAGLKALANTGDEVKMREALGAVVAGILKQVNPQSAIRPTPAEVDTLLAAADIVTLCRTGVEYDYRGGIIDAHAPEMPTRFAKQLLQIMRGACAIGMDRPEALRLAIRCARDSMPPLRLAILDDVAAHPHTRTRDVRQRLDKPYNTVDRQLQALHMLRVLDCDEVEDEVRQRSSWHYSVSSHINPSVIRVPEISPHKHWDTKKEAEGPRIYPDISGTRIPSRDAAWAAADARFKAGWKQ
jgi:hypothetical protein